MSVHNKYESPLTSRYASPEMAALFSPANCYYTWRKPWLKLAIAEKELDIPGITIQEMERSSGKKFL